MLAVAFLGYNFVHLFERFTFPVLVVIFVAGMAVILPARRPAPIGRRGPGRVLDRAGRLVRLHRRLEPLRRGLLPLPAGPPPRKRAGIFAGLGNFLSSTVLQIAGAAAVTAVGVANWDGGNPTGSYISLMPGWLGGVTLLAIFIGAISANALNLYSARDVVRRARRGLPDGVRPRGARVVVGLAGLVVAHPRAGATSRRTRASCW